MPKYYLQCGSFDFLTTADDARSAALWAIHCYVSDRVALDSIDWTDSNTIDRQDLIVALLELGDEMVVSEIGCGRDDAGQLETADILNEWNQLVVAVSRLEAAINNDAA
jgi:hypothetical protein